MEKITNLLAVVVGFFVAELGALDSRRESLTALQSAVQDIGPAVEAYGKEREDKGYDLGVQDTLAKQGLPATTGLYSLEEANQMIAEAVAPKDKQIADQAAQLETMSARISELEAVDHTADIQAAVAKREKEIAAEIRSTNVDDLALADRLDPKSEPAPEVQA